MPTILYCRKCWAGTVARGAIPTRCPACHTPTKWTTAWSDAVGSASTSKQFTLTADDRLLLQSLHIRCDPEDCFNGRAGV